MSDLSEIADGLRVASTWLSGPRSTKLAAYADELDAHDCGGGAKAAGQGVELGHGGEPVTTEGDTPLTT